MRTPDAVSQGWVMRSRLAPLALIVGALCYASWLLGPVVNDHLSLTTSLVSELAADGQPMAVIFRLSDVIAGTLIGAASLLLWASTRQRRARRGWASLALFGLATIADGLSPLSCVATADHRCAAAELALAVPPAHAVHLVSSSLAGLLLVAAMVLLSGTARRQRWPLWVAAAVSLAGLGWTMAAMAEASLLVGVAHRISLTAASAWLIVASRRLHDDPRTVVVGGHHGF